MVKKDFSTLAVLRGSVVKLEFGPGEGHEQLGYRPAIVVSDSDFYKMTGFALCVPVTSKKKGLVFEIDVEVSNISGVALPHAAKMVDLRARNFSVVGKASSECIEQVQCVLSKIIFE